MHNSSPPEMHQDTSAYTMHDEVPTNDMNALIAYEELVYHGEPLSRFERQVFYRMDTLSANQRAYFEMTQARFQNLNHQIEGVHEKLTNLITRRNDLFLILLLV